jgi:hypothetical protein
VSDDCNLRWIAEVIVVSGNENPITARANNNIGNQQCKNIETLERARVRGGPENAPVGGG